MHTDQMLEYAGLLNNLGIICRVTQRFDEALKLYNEALDIRLRYLSRCVCVRARACVCVCV